MWKFVFVLLVTALALLVAQLIADAPVIQYARRRGEHKCRCRSPMPMQASGGD